MEGFLQGHLHQVLVVGTHQVSTDKDDKIGQKLGAEAKTEPVKQS